MKVATIALFLALAIPVASQAQTRVVTTHTYDSNHASAHRVIVRHPVRYRHHARRHHGGHVVARTVDRGPHGTTTTTVVRR